MSQGLLAILGVHFYYLGYKMCRRGTFSKRLPRIVSIITTTPNKPKKNLQGSSLVFSSAEKR